MDCLFCKIIKKEIPATIVFEDEKMLAFRDISPQAPAHLLVIPKKHISTINDLTVDDAPIIGEMALTAKLLMKQEGCSETGYRLVMNCNKDAGQAVFHIHMHVLAGRRLQWPPG
jgi:histidine triad (HIT) family protein